MAPRYFAYGSALDAAHVAEWAREHGHPANFLDDGLPGALDDYALVFTASSRYWGGSVGTLEPRVGSTVYGVVFELDAKGLEIVRHKEGARTGLYRETSVEVRLVVPGDADATLQLYDAAAYVAAQPGPEGTPSGRWLDSVIAGARAYGLPPHWITVLEDRRR